MQAGADVTHYKSQWHGITVSEVSSHVVGETVLNHIKQFCRTLPMSSYLIHQRKLLFWKKYFIVLPVLVMLLYSPVLKVVQERSRVSPAIRGRVPLPRIFYIFIFDLKMASFDASLVVFYAI